MNEFFKTILLSAIINKIINLFFPLRLGLFKVKLFPVGGNGTGGYLTGI
jgi:hypothetical protein